MLKGLSHKEVAVARSTNETTIRQQALSIYRNAERRSQSREFAAAKRNFEGQWPAFLSLEVTAAVSREAGAFAERYALRGFDALHLASFAEIARRVGAADTRFSSFDDPLNKAARDLARRLSAGG